MKEKKLVILKPGLKPQEVAAMASCCKSGPTPVRTYLPSLTGPAGQAAR